MNPLIPLYLLACHLIGDFLLQSRSMAALKLTNAGVRFWHVAVYAIPFWVLMFYLYHPGASWHPLAFVYSLMVLHFFTDSRRFTSSPMDWLEWKFMSQAQKRDEWLHYFIEDEPISTPMLKLRDAGKLPPNAWKPLSIVIDQTLHLIQIAVLAGVFLT